MLFGEGNEEKENSLNYLKMIKKYIKDMGWKKSLKSYFGTIWKMYYYDHVYYYHVN